MTIALPQLSTQLEPAQHLAKLLAKDETLTLALIDSEDITGLKAKSFTASEVRFDKVVMTEAKLEKTGFTDVILAGCDLIATVFTDASWQRLHIKSSRCSGVQLQMSTLKDVTFTGCKLNLANFRFAKLKNVLFEDCALDEADFYSAELVNVQFKNCTLEKTVFSAAKLKSVDLRTSDIFNILGIDGLAGATIDSTQLLTLAPMLAAEFKIKVIDD